MRIDPFRLALLRAPDGAGGGAPAPAGTPAPANPPAEGWWTALDPDNAAFVATKGLTGKSEAEALPALLGMYRNAEKMLGNKGLPLPEKGADPADWLVQHREALGLPGDVAAYAVQPPEGFDPALWDNDLAAKAAEVAHAAGVPPRAHGAYVKLFVDRMAAMEQQAEAARAQANADMMVQLERDFGKETPARIQAAQQAAQALAQEAGIDTEGLQMIGETLAAKVGMAPVIRIFDIIARAMADDRLPMGGAGGGTLSTKAAAEAELANLLAPEGEYGKALAKALRTGDKSEQQRLQPRVDALRRAIAGGA